MSFPGTEHAFKGQCRTVPSAQSHKLGQADLLSMLVDSDHFVQQIIVPHIANISFEVGGIPFQAKHSPDGESGRLVIWGTLGYLPYSVTSPEKRRALIAILEASRRLPHVKFGIDQEMRIVASAEYVVVNPPTPLYIFAPLINFIQESRGFTSLIGEYL